LLRFALLPLLVAAMGIASPALLSAQTFQSIPELTFSKTFGGSDPLPQSITVASAGAAFNFTAVATSTTGGSWLTITPSAYGYGVATPYPVTVNAHPAVDLAAGTYTGQIVFTPTTGTKTPITVAVKLVVHAATATYFDQVAGGLTFTMQTSGIAPPTQAVQIRNAGAGSLAWTATKTTSDGGAWLTLSAASGTAPSNLTVTVVPAKLPGGGLTAGTFTGQVALTSSGDSVTIPISFAVGDSVFRQVNPLSFVKTFGGPNPLSQVITAASTDAQFTFLGTVLSSTGGNWLTITPSAYGYGLSTPQAITVSVNPAVTLAAGTYMAEVLATSADGSKRLSIPVTLTINPATAAFFDNTAGALNFSMATSGDTPPAQQFQIRNAGAGALAWTATASTADGGKWLTLSDASGTSPSDLATTVDPANVPGGGLVAGVFVGQIVLQSATSRVTIPVSLTVGGAVFRQANPLNFTKVFGGANPLSQIVTIASTGANFTFYAVTANSTGGTWLTINPSAYGYGISTPEAITVSANPAITLAAGTYSAEIIAVAETGGQVLTIPVTLSVESATDTFFDALPGQMAFSMVTGGNAPPAQVLPIRNAGDGVLDWTATTTTSDGGAWLAISAASGSTPSEPNVSVKPANLPGGGLIAGTFTGQVILETSGNRVTVPVSLVVGSNVFYQLNPLSFTMVYGGGIPLPQVVTVASTGTSFTFLGTTVSSTGGNWLTITPSAYGYGLSTPQAVTVTVNPPPTLAAGTYSAQVVFQSAGGAQAITVPVTLTILPNTAASFDSLPGELSFSMATSGNAPPAQPLEIRNAGAGALAWTGSVSTADGGKWLTISAASGTAPAVPQISVVPANLPGLGLTAGTYSGQVTLETTGDRVTIPVTMVVGAAVFNQVNALDFTKVYSGANPLPQIVTISSTGATFNFLAVVATSSGGNWLTISPSAYGYGIATPHTLVVTANPAVTLAAGTYTAEIIAKSATGSPSLVIPVTLTVSPTTAAFFDDLPGGVSFFQATGGAAPAAQSIPIRNAGAGRLNWTATVSTADGGGWLSISAASGTAPSSISASITPSKLPGQGLIAGQYGGQILLTNGTDRETIPVSVVVGANVFKPVAALAFSKAYGGSNPASQIASLASTAANFTFLGEAATATGTPWLTINPSAYGYGVSTPESVTVAVDPATTLAAGSYIGEVLFTSAAGDQGMVLPVKLTVNSATAAATPTFSPAGGIYTTPQTVTITDATRGAAIYYTLDGTTPTTASKVYSVPLTVTPSETVTAIAVAPGYPTSAAGKAAYNLPPPAATPVFKPVAGTYITTQSVTITDATTGAVIYYTVNGTTPTTSSTKYTAAISVPATETIKAIAAAANYTDSAVATAVYTITPPAATPVIKPAGGTYTTTQSVTITDATAGSTIYYTTNGSAPTSSSTKYTGAISVAATETINAAALAPGYSLSAVATAAYTIVQPAATPVFKPAGGTYTSTQSVTITSTTTGAVIHYTTDGTTPTTSSTKYTAAISVSATETIKAIATATGFGESAVATAAYTINQPKAATPGVSQAITITEATTGSTVYYTTDGSTPTTSSTKYTGPITLTASQVLKFIAVAPGYSPSAVRTVTDTVQ
jgi:hypothetical protein